MLHLVFPRLPFEPPALQTAGLTVGGRSPRKLSDSLQYSPHFLSRSWTVAKHCKALEVRSAKRASVPRAHPHY